jgi:4-hydroxy-3-methylbut-2-en-1-yl diphosphate reductase
VTPAGLLILTPLGVEAAAVRRGAPGARVVRAGMGRRRARRTAQLLAGESPRAIAVAGLCGALDPALRPGDVVVARELRDPDGRAIHCSGGAAVAAVARARGLRVHEGTIATCARPVTGAHRERLRAATGALAVDMESAWLADAAPEGVPLAVVRVVVDTPVRELRRPIATVAGGLRALRALRRAAAALADWGAAVEPRVVLLAAPRASCAGVERAVRTVEELLDKGGGPVYVRKQIVHNAHVIEDLRRRGAVFVDSLEEVPPGSLTVFSAHGVSPAVRAQARERKLSVVDATCPLVAKVHAEARRFAQQGYTTALIGHAGHEEVEGTLGEAPDSIRLIEGLADVERLEVEDPERVAYLTQTTLAVDETSELVEALRARFPSLVGPPADDICYATQNRQVAIRAIAPECDRVLVVGSANSSNGNRLREVAERGGAQARMIEDESGLDPAWLAGARIVGITAAASTPESVVQRVVAALRGLGPIQVEERVAAEETVRFRLPVMNGKRDA